MEIKCVHALYRVSMPPARRFRVNLPIPPIVPLRQWAQSHHNAAPQPLQYYLLYNVVAPAPPVPQAAQRLQLLASLTTTVFVLIAPGWSHLLSASSAYVGSRSMLQRNPRHRLRAVRRAETGRHDAGLQRQPLRHPRRGHRDACAHEREAFTGLRLAGGPALTMGWVAFYFSRCSQLKNRTDGSRTLLCC